MAITKEITMLIQIFNNETIWLYIGIFFATMYLLTSLLTWSFIKPLKYLGIPTILVGMVLLIIRVSASILTGFIKVNSSIIKVLLPGVLKPILLNGILCIVLGIIMIVIYIIVNKIIKNKKVQPELT